MTDQHWLSLEGICGVLNITRKHALWLAKNGHLAFLPGRTRAEARYLDPTPEYKEKLKRCEAFYGRTHPLPIELDMAPLLSLREIAEIMGWTLHGTRTRAATGRIKGGVRVGAYILYPTSVVRDLLWRRRGRKMAKQRAPFLIQELIDFFLARSAEAAEGVPLDVEFAGDDLLQKKLERLARMPHAEREVAMREFYQKVALAKTVAAALHPQG
jgi:hypothetical protein